MSYEIHVRQAPPEHVATKRMHTTLAHIGDAMHATLAQIGASVSPRGAARGAPFAIYYNEPFRPDDIDVELGMPIAAGAEIAPSAGAIKNLPGGAVAYTVHTGRYESIGAAYDALYDWLTAHGVRPSGPPREIYVVGPAPGIRPEEYRTEIVVPVDGVTSAA